MTEEKNTPPPADVPQRTAAEIAQDVRRALEMFRALRVAFDEAIPLIDAAADALSYVKSESEDLGRARRALDRALTAVAGIR